MEGRACIPWSETFSGKPITALFIQPKEIVSKSHTKQCHTARVIQPHDVLLHNSEGVMLKSEETLGAFIRALGHIRLDDNSIFWNIWHWPKLRIKWPYMTRLLTHYCFLWKLLGGFLSSDLLFIITKWLSFTKTCVALDLPSSQIHQVNLTDCFTRQVGIKRSLQ